MKRAHKKTIQIVIVIQLFLITGIIGVILRSHQRSNVANDVALHSRPFHKTLRHFYELPLDNEIQPFKDTAPQKAEYRINNTGLHDLFDYPEEKEKNVTRIITLGDSFTFGLYVDTADNWTEKVESLLNRTTCRSYEVINLGVYGYDFRYAYERFKKYGQKYQPDLVIWVLADAERINEALFSKIESTKQITYETLAQAKKMYVREWSEDKINQYQLAVLEEFSMEFSQNHILVTMPWYSKKFMNSIQQMDKNHSAFSYTKSIEHIVSDKNLLFENDGHPNIKGHEAIAEVVAVEILRQFPSECSTR